MSLIKEPKGVDFIIQSKPLTDVERKEISAYIQQQKLKKKRTGTMAKVGKKASQQQV
ncbi:hypothetical protein [Parapedobacter tibetensis]|uniref:hypothetical protein n=1 Tax=Parapedobacter tibetensis TaxID=2972951 RepID=UPI00214D6EBE|nr:hypothetical protein [Parapedobacter tibetensis]